MHKGSVDWASRGNQITRQYIHDETSLPIEVLNLADDHSKYNTIFVMKHLHIYRNKVELIIS